MKADRCTDSVRVRADIISLVSIMFFNNNSVTSTNFQNLKKRHPLGINNISYHGTFFWRTFFGTFFRILGTELSYHFFHFSLFVQLKQHKFEHFNLQYYTTSFITRSSVVQCSVMYSKEVQERKNILFRWCRCWSWIRRWRIWWRGSWIWCWSCHSLSCSCSSEVVHDPWVFRDIN